MNVDIDTVKIHYIKSERKKTCYLSHEQMIYFGLDDTKDTLNLSFGFINMELQKLISSDPDPDMHKIYLSDDLESCMFIPNHATLQIKKISSDQLELGPLIGIFINEKNINYINSGKSVASYNQYSAACKSLYGLCCLFSIENIDWDNNTIDGLIKNNNRWINTTLPLPKVIYDRNVKKRIDGIELRERLDGKCHIINCFPKLGKIETIESLSKNPALINFIPETIPYRSSADVENKLQYCPCLYVKPNSLSKGKGIYRISINNTSNSEYVLDYRNKDSNHTVYLQNIDDLEQYVSQYSTKGGGYIIQNEIKKASFRGNPFDFRLLYQKNWQGEWIASGIAVRMGAPGSVITSPRSGGSVALFQTVLKEVFNEDISTPNGLYENVISIGREIALAIEHEFGDCVELGLDMTIDINRKIWIIEVNGKPLKVSLKWLKNPSLISRCNKRPIEYAVYLTGFKSADTGLGGLRNPYSGAATLDSTGQKIRNGEPVIKPNFHTKGGMPVAMVRINIAKGLEQILQIAEGYSVEFHN